MPDAESLRTCWTQETLSFWSKYHAYSGTDTSLCELKSPNVPVEVCLLDMTDLSEMLLTAQGLTPACQCLCTYDTTPLSTQQHQPLSAPMELVHWSHGQPWNQHTKLEMLELATGVAVISCLSLLVGQTDPLLGAYFPTRWMNPFSACACCNTF